MIFIMKDALMNGAVTTETLVTGIEADSFESATKKLRKILYEIGAVVIQDSNDELSYKKERGGQVILYGSLKPEPLKML